MMVSHGNKRFRYIFPLQGAGPPAAPSRKTTPVYEGSRQGNGGGRDKEARASGTCHGKSDWLEISDFSCFFSVTSCAAGGSLCRCTGIAGSAPGGWNNRLMCVLWHPAL